MQAMARYKTGGFLLATGTGMLLMLKTYGFIVNEKFPLAYKLLVTTFGYWFGNVVMPQTVNGELREFTWNNLIIANHAGVIAIFLMWAGIKVIRGKSISLIPLSILGVLSAWFTFEHLHRKIIYGYSIYAAKFKAVIEVVSLDLIVWAIVTGIAIILFTHKEAILGDDNQRSKRKEPSLGKLLFSFDGRVSRGQFWLYQVLCINLMSAVVLGIEIFLHRNSDVVILIAWQFLTALTLWPTMALNVKRCHDRNRSGWFCLVALIPFLNLWYVVEMLFLPGSDGGNLYGIDPLSNRVTT